MTYILFVNHRITKLVRGQRIFKEHGLYLQAHEPILVYIHHRACFIYFVSLLTSSEPTR